MAAKRGGRQVFAMGAQAVLYGGGFQWRELGCFHGGVKVGFTFVSD